MKILIMRGYGKKQNLRNYNSQEIGLAKALINKGHEVHIAVYNGRENSEKVINYKDKEIKIIGLKGISFFGQGIYSKLNNLFDSYDFIWSNEVNQFASFYMMRNGYQGVIYHGPYIEKFFSLKSIKELFFMLLYRRKETKSQLIFTKSELARKTLEKFGYGNIRTVGVGLDIDGFKVKSCNRTDEINILYIGALSKRRNILFMLKVFNEVHQRMPNVRMTIIGDGEERYKSKIKEYIERKKLNDTVSLIKKVPNTQLPKYYNEASLFLLPTSYEIFGMVILEAMYYGVPVLTTNNGGSSTIIRNNANGYILKELDVDVWAKRVMSILNHESREAISKNAHKTVAEDFTWDAILQSIAERKS